MANYHVLDISNNRDTARVVWHFAVANVNNGAGINYRTALKQYLESQADVAIGRVISQVPWLEVGNPSEFAQITNCEVYELVQNVEFNANETNSNKAAMMDAMWTKLNVAIPKRISEMLRFWGLDRNVA